MRLLELPDDALRAIVSVLMAAHADAEGYVCLRPELRAVARTHSRLRAAVLRELTAVCLDGEGWCDELLLAASPHRLALCGAAALPPRVLPLRELCVSSSAVSDGAVASLLRPGLARLSVNDSPLGAAALSAAGGCRLHALKLRRVWGVTPRALRRLLACSSLREVALDVGFPAAPHVADKCMQLSHLEFGRADTIPAAISRAVTANWTSLEHLVIVARQVNGAAILPADALAPLLVQCHALRTLDIGPLPACVLHAPRRWQVTTEYIRGDDDGERPIVGQRAQGLEWEGLPAARGLELGVLHGALRTLVLRAVAGCTDATLGAVGARTGRLRRIRLELLPDVTALGLEALLRPNSRVGAFGVGAKCRKLSNVSIMRALARHARALRIATFPRWSAAAGRAADPHLAAALAAFRAAVPNARIRAE